VTYDLPEWCRGANSSKLGLKNMRILITGKDGQVGSEFSRLYRQQREVVFVGRDECDLSSESPIRELIRRIRPAVVINTAAYTAVDLAEKERDLCFAINAGAPRVLAQEAARLDALLIHYSTDYVFNGAKPEPYVETDAIGPLGVYGESKQAGEAAIQENASRYLVLRTSWVYSAHGKNFLRTMLRLGAERPELRVVDDQVGAPTSAAAIAAATARLLAHHAVPSGIYHMTAGGSTSWCGFARAIFASGVLASPPSVTAIASSEYPTPARRPANSILSNDKFAHTFGFRLAPWQQQLQEVMARMTEMNGAIR
jgi:dTDP-4-dehydrorhamnose reductase